MREEIVRSVRAATRQVLVLACTIVSGSCDDPVCPPGTTEVQAQCMATDPVGIAGEGESASAGTNGEESSAAESAAASGSASIAGSSGSETGGSSASNGEKAAAAAGGMSAAAGASAASTNMSGAGAAGMPAAGQGGTPSGVAGSGQPPCESSNESCDGNDNDCDGSVDEGLVQQCGAAMMGGACKPGSQTCAAGAWTECVGAVEPAAESCDPERLDEDCDGMRNEGCECIPGEQQPCGVDRGICRPGMETCVDGKWGGVCEGAYDPKQPEVCDEAKLDENCDGDANPGCECFQGQAPRPCPGGNDTGECTAGTQTCTGGRWSACMGARAPGTESCNGKDDDCNGTVDNDPSDCRSPMTCRSGRCEECRDGESQDCEGSSTGECSPPRRTCTGGRWGQCTGGKSASSEQCDGLDNDCDGDVDDSAQGCTANQTCSNGRCMSKCGNGRLDVDEEECDYMAPGWSSACSQDCKRLAYTDCSSSCGSGSTCVQYQQFSSSGTRQLPSICARNCMSNSDCDGLPGYTATVCTFGNCAVACEGDRCPNRMRCERGVVFDLNGTYLNEQDFCVPDV